MIFDVAARRSFLECRRALAPGGLDITTMPVPLSNLLWARGRGRLATIATMVERGELRPIVGRTFALEEAAAAHRALECGGRAGKIVLEVA